MASLITVGMILVNLTGCGNKEASQSGTPNEIRLDYATYNIESLVIKEKGWLEDEFKKDGTKITFV